MISAGAGSRILAFGQKAFEDQNRRDLIDHGAVLLTWFAKSVQMAVRFAAGQSLVGEVDGQTKRSAKLLGKGLGLKRLRADFAGHVKRVADDDFRNGMFAKHAADGLNICVQRAALQREQRLHGEAEWIRDGEPNAFAADIQREKTRRQGRSRHVGLEPLFHFRSVAGEDKSRYCEEPTRRSGGTF